jgi:hypothetical protein
MWIDFDNKCCILIFTWSQFSQKHPRDTNMNGYATTRHRKVVSVVIDFYYIISLYCVLCLCLQLAEKQQIPILWCLVWPDRGSNPRSTALEGEHANHNTTDAVYFESVNLAKNTPEIRTWTGMPLHGTGK